MAAGRAAVANYASRGAAGPGWPEPRAAPARTCSRLRACAEPTRWAGPEPRALIVRRVPPEVALLVAGRCGPAGRGGCGISLLPAGLAAGALRLCPAAHGSRGSLRAPLAAGFARGLAGHDLPAARPRLAVTQPRGWLGGRPGWAPWGWACEWGLGIPRRGLWVAVPSGRGAGAFPATVLRPLPPVAGAVELQEIGPGRVGGGGCLFCFQKLCGPKEYIKSAGSCTVCSRRFLIVFCLLQVKCFSYTELRLGLSHCCTFRTLKK